MRRTLNGEGGQGPGPQPPISTATVHDALQPPTVEQISSAAAAPLVDGVFESAAFTANPIFDFVDPDGSGPQLGTLDARRLFGPAVDMILARRNASGTIAWYLTDHLGTVRDIASTSGAVIDHISYSAFGKVTAETNPSNGDRFKYTGREYDTQADLYYSRARELNPFAGRFLSQDPMGFSGGDANVFRYVLNAPTILVDASGLEVDDPPRRSTLEAIQRLAEVSRQPDIPRADPNGLEVADPPPSDTLEAIRRLGELGRQPDIPRRIDLPPASSTSTQTLVALTPQQAMVALGITPLPWHTQALFVASFVTTIVACSGSIVATVVFFSGPHGLLFLQLIVAGYAVCFGGIRYLAVGPPGPAAPAGPVGGSQ